MLIIDFIKYTTLFHTYRKLKQDTTVFTSLGLPNYATSEYDEIDRTHPITFRVLTNPVKAASNGCLKQGPIGLALNGVPFLNVYTSTGTVTHCKTYSNVMPVYMY